LNAQACGVEALVDGSTRILAISGSLRAQSSNTAVLQAVALLAPPAVELEIISRLDALPHFNPDLDAPGMAPPPSVLELRRRVGAADALMVCSPEYAHGVPGTLKNALDWLVSAPEVFAKPVALLNASPRSWHAQASLAETLRTMAMRLVPATSITIPVMGRQVDAAAIAEDPQLAAVLRSSLDALVRAARAASPHDEGRQPAVRGAGLPAAATYERST
jgi:NAD(P)H-dependent FMN reductase